MALSRTYRKWDSMIARCYRVSHPAYKYYGGRGVTVHESWRTSYQNFLKDMGEAPPGLWLDRIDNDKGYGPGNCRWVTPQQSAQNRKQRQHDPNSLKSRCKQAGVPYMLVTQRLRLGWTEAQAMSIPKLAPGNVPIQLRDKYGIKHRAKYHWKKSQTSAGSTEVTPTMI